MKIKTLMTVFTTITLLSIAPAFTLSQFNRLTSDAQTSVSEFSAPQNLGATVNAEGNEGGMFVASNGLSLYFSGNRTGGFGAPDIYVCRTSLAYIGLGVPQNLGAVINTESSENQPGLSLDGLTMFFNSERGGGQDIYISTRPNANDDFGWTAPVNVGPAINTGSNEVGAAYFEDPATDTPILYFASDRTGNIDIYQSKRNPNGTFNTASSVTSLNSAGDDSAPTISRNGLEMFLSSDRNGGLEDIWVSTRASVGSQWNPPVNVATVNSEFGEFNPALSPDGSVLYFNSTRAGGSGSSDIYTAHRLCTTTK